MKKPLREIDNNRILTPHQQDFLRKFAASELKDVFRLTGGTALSAFYLEHRLSEDLVFFSSEKAPLSGIERLLKTLKDVHDISQTKLSDGQIFNLKFKDHILLKVEFTSYPLKNLENTVKVQKVQVDSFLDIVVNMLCAIADRSDARDYVDVYSAIKNSGLSLAEWLKLAERKCEVKDIGYILKNRLLQVPEGIGRLHLKIEVTGKEIGSFFIKQVREMVGKEIRGK